MTQTTFLPTLDIQNKEFTDEHNVKDPITKKIDLEKLKDYFEMSLVVRQRVSGKNNRIHIPFRRCTVDDFTKRKLSEDAKIIDSYAESLFCPDFDKYPEFIEVVNLYNNAELRHSFSVEIYLCNPRYRSTCVSNDKANRLFKQFYITLSTVVDRVDYSNSQ